MDQVYLAVPATIAALGAYLDWQFRRLPNMLCLAAFAGGTGWTFALYGANAAGLAVLHAVLALLAGMFVFSRGWIGGGDAKFYAGLAAWVPLQAAWLLILSVSLAGLLLLLAWYPFRRKLAPAGQAGAQRRDQLKLPYGVAIAVGALATISMLRTL
ncbi:MAG: A24 family peptidase [Pseudomonadota bacterium]